VGKKIDCGKVNPSSGCGHIVRGETEEELLQNAKAHPQIMEMIKAHIEDE
jgi:predicted small metal-binding protein